MARPRTNPAAAPRRGFTLTEILVAVAVLVAVLLATSRIFSTTQQVTSAGEANADVLAEVAAIERRLREDIANLSYDGYFAIRSVALRNDQLLFDGNPATVSLLNPALPPDAVIRADQLLFFREGLEQPQVHRIGAREKIRPRGTISRVLWSHGVSGALRERPSGLVTPPPVWRAYDLPILDEEGAVITPWSAFRAAPPPVGDPIRYDPVCTAMQTVGSTEVFDQSPTCPDVVPPGVASLPRVEARDWPLVRQAAVLLSDDPAGTPADALSRRIYQDDSFGDVGGVHTARSIFLVDPHPDLQFPTPELRNGRVDAAGILLDDIHRRLEFRDPEDPGDLSTTNRRPWRDGGAGPDGIGADDRFSYLVNSEFGALWYPIVEKVPPSSHRADQALTVPIIGTNVSSIRIEWTWDEGTGEAIDEANRRYLGVAYRDLAAFGFDPVDPTQDWRQQPALAGDRVWFGLPAEWERPRSAPYAYGRRPDSGGGIAPLVGQTLNPNGLLGGQPRWTRAGTIDWWNVEAFDPDRLLEFRDGDAPVVEYVAAFGRNRTRPLARFDEDGDAIFPAEPTFDLAYTPWPSAIRVTLTVHDPALDLELGREVQFTIDLPDRRERTRGTGLAGDVRQDPDALRGASIILQDGANYDPVNP